MKNKAKEYLSKTYPTGRSAIRTWQDKAVIKIMADFALSLSEPVSDGEIEKESELLAMSIVNYVNEKTGASVEIRQSTNDDTFDYTMNKIIGWLRTKPVDNARVKELEEVLERVTRNLKGYGVPWITGISIEQLEQSLNKKED